MDGSLQCCSYLDGLHEMSMTQTSISYVLYVPTMYTNTNTSRVYTSHIDFFCSCVGESGNEKPEVCKIKEAVYSLYLK